MSWTRATVPSDSNPGTKVWLEPNDDPKKKLRFGWRLVDHENGHFTGVDTSLPNRALKKALMAREVPAFAAYSMVRPEVKYGRNSRIDFLLSQAGLPDAYIEVKSVTLSRQTGIAEFPDSVTARGAKHLGELATRAEAGDRAIMLYLVQRTDCTEFTLAEDIDPAYSAAYRSARNAGVETYCLCTDISPRGIEISRPLEIRI